MKPPQKPLLWMALAFYSLMFLGALAWLAWARRPIELGLGLKPAALGLAVGLMVVGLTRLALVRLAFVKRMAHDFRALLEPLSLLDLVLLAAVSGVIEELFFRAALQPAVGLVPASVIFGAVHIGPSRDYLPWTLFAIVMGFVLGALYAATGDLAAPILAHATVNAFNLPLLKRQLLDAQERGGGAGLD